MSKDIAMTILAQLGGQRFVAMTGAHSFVYEGKALHFRLRSNITKQKAQGMKITLNGKDYYDLEMFKIENFEVVLLDKKNDVDVESLQNTFTEMTGLATRL